MNLTATIHKEEEYLTFHVWTPFDDKTPAFEFRFLGRADVERFLRENYGPVTEACKVAWEQWLKQ
jgi:hypothetical protein